MAPTVDSYWYLAKGAENLKLRLQDLESAQENENHAQSMGAGRSRRWLWLMLIFVMIAAALFLLYQLSGASDAMPSSW